MHKYIHPLHNNFPKQVPSKPVERPKTLFKDVLAEASKVKVSKHAQARLHERDIHISEKKWKLVEQKMNEARTKGVTDALVVMEDVALIVSTKNNTVITALHHQEAENKIFTNINGTIII